MSRRDISVVSTRRDVLRLGALSTCLGFIPVLPAFAAEFRQREIPSSGERLPVVGLGTSRVFDVGADASGRAACREVLAALVEAGASLVDSSPMYRSAEEVAGEVANQLGVSNRVFWATKVWATGQEAGIAQMTESMRLFHTDQIDLMQVHNLQDWKTHMPILRDWKAAGRIRYIGITHSRANAFGEVEKVINATELDFVQLNYSIAEREAQERLLPLCADKGIATLINRPFARGDLFRKVSSRVVPDWAKEFGAQTWGQFFLKFILAHPAATCVIPATRKANHMVDNLGAGFGPVPDEVQRQAMIEFVNTL